jgi:hypothetical protein
MPMERYKPEQIVAQTMKYCARCSGSERSSVNPHHKCPWRE